MTRIDDTVEKRPTYGQAATARALMLRAILAVCGSLRPRRRSNTDARSKQRSRRLGFILVPVMALLGLSEMAGGSIPEDRNPQQWDARYNGPADHYDAAFSLAMAPDGSKVFVTGASRGSGSSSDYATVAYSSATGSRIWVARYNGRGNTHDYAYSVAVSPDGSKVFVTGFSDGLDSSSDYATIAYSTATGAQLWVARYNGLWKSSYDRADSLAVSPDGSKVLVTGSSDGSFATVAYATETGAQLWVARYNGPGNAYEDADSLAVSPDGSQVFVTGDTDYPDNEGPPNAVTVAYSTATGAQLWVAHGDGSIHEARSLAVSPDGSKVFVTGYSHGYGNFSDYATVAYSTDIGAQLWVARYNGPRDSPDIAYSLAVSPDGSKVFVTGSSDSMGIGSDYATVAYATETGAQLWVSRYSGPGDWYDTAYFLAVSPDGTKVFVTGTSDTVGIGSDYATVSYSTETGAQLWVARYNHFLDSDDNAYSLAVSPDGSTVFVTGSTGSEGYNAWYDYATVAYPTATCANGEDEYGPVSDPIHYLAEPHAGPTAAPYLHGVNCDAVADNGL